MDGYRIPAAVHRTELIVANSRFITTAAPVFSSDEAKEILASIRAEMPDASHHVYAFRIGYANSVSEGMSDDGEPSGTSGPPTLAVLRGAKIGDIIIVNTRYFGGTKLGTGGLVRAYSDATRQCLDALQTILKVKKSLLGLDVPYTFYENVKLLLAKHDGVLIEETFTDIVTLYAELPRNNVQNFNDEVIELSSGTINPIDLSDLSD